MANNNLPQLNKSEPRFFYGYIVVTAAFFIMMMTIGQLMVFGVFFKPLQAEFGWSSAVTSGAFSLSAIITGVMGIVMGKLTDRFGPRIVITICGFLIGLGYFLMSQMNAGWQLYLFFGVMIGSGCGGGSIPSLSTVARWFMGRRGLMSGIVVSGTAIGTLIGSPVISRLIDAYGWRLSYMIMGSIVLIIMILAAQFMKREPAQMGQLPYGADEEEKQGLKTKAGAFSLREAVSTTQFWLVIFIFFCFGFSIDGPLVHIVPHAIEIGIPAVAAANFLAINFGISILGNFVLGSLGDRIGSRQIYIIGLMLMAAALFWLMLASELWMLYLFSVVFGIAFGGIGASQSPLVAWLFGLRSHGVLYGFAMLGFTGGAAVGPVVMGHIFDLIGSYRMAFLVGAGVGIVGMLSTVILRPTKKLKAEA